MTDILTWEAGSEAEKVAENTTPIEGSNINYQELSMTQSVETIPLDTSGLGVTTFQNFIEGFQTFDGQFSKYFSLDDVVFYNSSTKYVNNSNIVDKLRKDSNNVVFFDEISGTIIEKPEIDSKIHLYMMGVIPDSNNHIEHIKIVANKSNPDFQINGKFDSTKWSEYVFGMKQKSFINYPFYKDVPYNRDDSSDKNIDVNFYVDVIPKYNFLDKRFEDASQRSRESDLPNLYQFMDSYKDDKFIENAIGNILSGDFQKLKIDFNISKYIFSRKNYRDYINKSKKYLSVFPTTTEIKISSKTEQIFETIFNKVDLSQFVAQNYNLSNDTYNVDIFRVTYEKNSVLDSEITKEAKTVGTKILPFFNIVEKFELEDDEIIFGEKQSIENMTTILKSLIAQKTIDLYPKYRRSLRDIFDCKPCYNESLVYRISKFNKNNEKLMEVYLPNLSKTELSYIDIQTKYDKDYRYDITAYSLIYASCYTYVLDGEVGEDNAFFNVKIEPVLLISETPYYSETVFAIDAPPVHPFADFFAYENYDNRILINFHQNSGRYEKEPFYFNSNEGQKVQRIKEFQRRRNSGDKILYKSDDIIETIQVFKTVKPPKTYFDFGRSSFNIDLNTSTSFIDFVNPNVKYYYMFRTIDYHNNFSDPSPVFQVELKNINGTSFIEVRNYKPEKVDNKVKNFRRFLFIDGAFDQTRINFEETGLKYLSQDIQEDEAPGKTAKELDSFPVLGTENIDSIFDSQKVFKIKIKSINSGKQFDVLLNFDTKHNK